MNSSSGTEWGTEITCRDAWAEGMVGQGDGSGNGSRPMGGTEDADREDDWDASIMSEVILKKYSSVKPSTYDMVRKPGSAQMEREKQALENRALAVDEFDLSSAARASAAKDGDATPPNDGGWEALAEHEFFWEAYPDGGSMAVSRAPPPSPRPRAERARG